MTLSETTLDELLSDATTRAALIRDAEAVLDRRVAASRGMTGLAVRAGYAAFRRVQPGIVPSALHRLAPHFAPVMDRHWAEARTQSDPAAHFGARARAIAADLLAVTDGMAERANSQVLASIYTSLRGRAEHEVAAAMPEVAGLLQRHLG
ncbi:MAG: hypothetical protein AAF602_01485 [Myxococcota bacterium]